MAQEGKLSSKAIDAVLHVLSPKRSMSHVGIEKQAAPAMELMQEIDENSLKKATLNEELHPTLLQRHWRWFLLLTVVCIVGIVVAAVVGARGISGDMSMGAAPFEPQTMSYTTISTSPVHTDANIFAGSDHTQHNIATNLRHVFLTKHILTMMFGTPTEQVFQCAHAGNLMHRINSFEQYGEPDNSKCHQSRVKRVCTLSRPHSKKVAKIRNKVNVGMPRGPLRRSASITDLRFTLRRIFGKESFRPLQEEVIAAVLEGNDVFLCAATSFGKSLCYQLPAVVSLGVTVVISPLLALMTNQVQAARDLGINVECINGRTPYQERVRIETDLLCGHPSTKLLYVTPELCATNHFRDLIRKIHRQGQLVRIAIDEAHCISEWGHDFRPAYKDLIWLKTSLNCPTVPVMAVTATATPQVREDIFKYLGLVKTKTKTFSTSTARPNIHYEVQYFSESNPENGQDDVFPYLLSRLSFMHQRRLMRLQYLREQDPTAVVAPITGIIYVSYRATADSLATKLSDAGIRAQSYHAGLEDGQRQKVQASFLRFATGDPRLFQASRGNDMMSSFNIMCATTAFGMGIDIPTIRFVVHYGLPRGMESFSQESGRAGRDNKAASSIILYTREEKERSEFRARSDANREKSKAKAESRLLSLQSVVTFCENTSVCRHDLLSRYFGGGAGSAECRWACDVCKEGPTKLKKRKEKGLATEHEAFEFTQRQGVQDYEYE